MDQDHQEMEARGMAESYVLGRLAPGEAAAFEEHLLTCAACREQVSWTEELRGALRDMAAADRQAPRTSAWPPVLTWVSRRGPVARYALAAGLLGVILLPVLLALDDARAHRELAAARTAAATAAAAGAPAPEVNVPIVSLGAARGGSEDGGSAAPVDRVPLAARPGWVVLSIELPAPGRGTYRATLTDAHGRTVWDGGGMRPTAGDTLVAALPARLLAPGRYRLLVQGAGTPPGGSRIVFDAVPQEEAPAGR